MCENYEDENMDLLFKISCGLLLTYVVVLLYLIKTMIESPIFPITVVMLSLYFAFLTIVALSAFEGQTHE